MSEIKANGSPVESGGRVEEVVSVRVRKYFTRPVACQLLALCTVEAKNLQASNDLRLSKDTYVCVGLDQEEIFRTAVVEKSLM